MRDMHRTFVRESGTEDRNEVLDMNLTKQDPETPHVLCRTDGFVFVT